MRPLWPFLLLAIAIGECSATVQAQATYVLKESAPRVGSQIKAEILRSPLPFDKSYEELTAAQIAVLRANYDHLAVDDEPPFPDGGMARIATEISRLAHNPMAHGPLVLTVHVDERGVAQSTAIYKTPDDGFASAIAAIVVEAKYKPAKCAGTPCVMDFPFIFDVGTPD
jgi:hypothetical protein